MNKLHPVLCFVFLAFAVFLTGCQGGGNSPSGYWKNTGTAGPAQRPPNTILQPGAAPQSPLTAENMPTDPNAMGDQEPALPPVKVGLLLPLSGQHGTLGKAMLDAAQMAVFDIGQTNFQLIPHDTKGTASGAASAAGAVISEGAQLILGPVFAEAVRSVKPIAAQRHINVIGFSTDWSAAGGNGWLMGFMPFDQVDRIIAYAASQNIRRIGVIAPETEYGQAVVSAYRNAASRYGIQTANIISFPPETANLSPLVRTFSKYDDRLRQAGYDGTQKNMSLAGQPVPFDAVLMPVGGETAVTISSLLSQYDLPPSSVKRLGTGLLDDPALSGEANLRNAWFAAPSPRLRKSFERRFISTYSYPPPRLATLAYDATALASVLAQRGFEQNGQPAFDAASINNPNGFIGIDGIFRFRNGGTAERGLAILEFQRGGPRIIDDAPQTFERFSRF